MSKRRSRRGSRPGAADRVMEMGLTFTGCVIRSSCPDRMTFRSGGEETVPLGSSDASGVPR